MSVAALEHSRKIALAKLNLKHFLWLLVILGLLLLNIRHNDQRHAITEAIALALLLLLLVLAYINGREQIFARFGGIELHYEVMVGPDYITRCVADHREVTLHVSEITRVEDAGQGIYLHTANRKRSVLIPRDLEHYDECRAELQRMGLHL